MSRNPSFPVFQAQDPASDQNANAQLLREVQLSRGELNLLLGFMSMLCSELRSGRKPAEAMPALSKRSVSSGAAPIGAHDQPLELRASKNELFENGGKWG